MAGVFQPTQSEIGGAGDVPVQGPGGTIAGLAAASQGLAGLLDTAIRASGNRGGGPSSKDVENQILRPVSAEINVIKQRTRNDPIRQRAELNSLYQRSLQQNPAYDDAINDLFKNQTFIDPDGGIAIEDTQTVAMQEWLQTPAGQLAAASSLVQSNDGSVDTLATAAQVEISFFNHQKEQAEAQRIKTLAETMGAENQIVKLEAERHAVSLVASQTEASQRLVQSLLSNFQGRNPDTGDPFKADQLVSQLRDLRLSLAAQFTSQANAAGVQVLAPNAWSVDQVLSPVDNLLATMTSAGSRMDDALKSMELATAQDRFNLGTVLNEVISVGGHQRDIQTFAVETLITENRPQIITTLDALSKGERIFGDTPTLVPFGELNDADAESSADPTTLHETLSAEGQQKIAGLSEDERNSVAQNGFTASKTGIPVNIMRENPEIANVSAGNLSRATEVFMKHTTQPMSERMFDEVFDERFWGTFNSMIELGGDSAKSFLRDGARVVTEQSRRRSSILEATLRQDFGFEAISVRRNQKTGNWELALVNPELLKFGTASGDVQIRDALRRAGLPLTESGFKKLIEIEQGSGITQPRNAPSLRLALQGRGTDSIPDQLRKLNKVSSAIDRLGELGNAARDQLEATFINSNVVVTNSDQFDALEPGTRFTFVDPETGERVDGVK